MRTRQTRFLGVLLAVTLLPTAACADMVWPALFLEYRLLSIPVIALGFLIETAMLRFGFQMNWQRAFGASFTVNLVSAIVGAVLIPVAGFMWELVPGSLLSAFLKMGTFNPFTWFPTFVIATGITTAIEVACLGQIFGLPTNRRTWLLWSLANVASVGLAFLSFFLSASDVYQYRL